MNLFTKTLLFSIGLILSFSSIYYAYAQTGLVNTLDTEDIMSKVLSLDNHLNPTTTATLTGLSLAGASFLMNLARSSDSDTIQIHLIKKYFIKAFFMFVLCTMILFVFDFLEVLNERNIILYTFLDVIISFSLFAVGVTYLIRAAKLLYSTYGK